MDGSALRFPGGTVLRFEDAVHRQFLTALTLIRSAAASSEEILTDYATARREPASGAGRGNVRTFVLAGTPRSGSAHRLAQTLAAQGIQVAGLIAPSKRGKHGTTGASLEAAHPFRRELRHLHGSAGVAPGPGGSRFDPPLGSAFLTTERKSLEENGPSLLYETTAWSPPSLTVWMLTRRPETFRFPASS